MPIGVKGALLGSFAVLGLSAGEKEAAPAIAPTTPRVEAPTKNGAPMTAERITVPETGYIAPMDPGACTVSPLDDPVRNALVSGVSDAVFEKSLIEVA